MTQQLWTPEFRRIAVAYLLLFVSFYMLLPMVPFQMESQLDIPLRDTTLMMLLFVPGMLLVGPLMSYLLDVYRRKSVAMFSFIVMSLVTLGYGFVQAKEEFMLLCVVHGMAFQMASVAGMTLGIDVTNTLLRNEGNVRLVVSTRLGMLLGVGIGVVVTRLFGFTTLLYASILVGLVSILILARMYVPFRAPIEVQKFSSDRFFMWRGVVPALNISFFTMMVGMLFSLQRTACGEGIQVMEVVIPDLIFVAVGFLLMSVVMLHVRTKRVLELVVAGSVLFLAGFTGMNTFWSVPCMLLIGSGIGMVVPVLLRSLIQLSEHCQRCTATATYQLSAETGVLLGIFLAVRVGHQELYRVGVGVAAAALLFFVCITYPYYKMMRRRD